MSTIVLYLGKSLGRFWGHREQSAGSSLHLTLLCHPPGDVHLAYSVWTSVCLRLDQYPTGVHTGKG